MKWCAKDIERFLVEKQYIDTMIIPLIPISWEKGMVPIVREGEYVQILVEELERQLKGRVVLSPPFTYLKSEALEERFKRLNLWKESITSGGGKYVYFVTADVDWKAVEKDVNRLIWLPAVPLEHMDEGPRNDFIAESIGSLIKTLTQEWAS